MKLVTAAEIREIDRRAWDEYAVPTLLLMENAGICTAGAAIDMLGGGAAGRTVAIVCGKGNNGGDGFVAARHLANSGAFVIVLLAADPDELKGDAKTNYEILAKRPALSRASGDLSFDEMLSNVLIHIIPHDDQPALMRAKGYVLQADLVIDGVFGTGLAAPIEGFYRDIVGLCDQPGTPVLAIDIPSGIHSDTGEVLGIAVKADRTVTLGAPKVGMLIYPGAEYCGEIVTADISLPQPLLQNPQLPYNYLTRPEALAMLPERPEDSNKGMYGKILTVGGSVGMTGAGALASLSALRIGAGLSYYALPESLNAAMESQTLEVITRPVAETADGSIAMSAFEQIAAWAQECDAVAIGPGISTNPETISLVAKVIAEVDKPMVIDADGIRSLTRESLTQNRLRTAIITPHPGEMARLMGMSIPEVQANRLQVAKQAAQRFRVIAVLKGAGTVIADPTGQVYVNTTGTPGMATAGAGDVLTGAIAGLLGQGLKPLHAAAVGSFFHGLAGEIAASEIGVAGMIAGDILNALPRALHLSGGGNDS